MQTEQTSSLEPKTDTGFLRDVFRNNLSLLIADDAHCWLVGCALLASVLTEEKCFRNDLLEMLIGQFF